jgi:hypothetical protein
MISIAAKVSTSKKKSPSLVLGKIIGLRSKAPYTLELSAQSRSEAVKAGKNTLWMIVSQEECFTTNYDAPNATLIWMALEANEHLMARWVEWHCKGDHHDTFKKLHKIVEKLKFVIDPNHTKRRSTHPAITSVHEAKRLTQRSANGDYIFSEAQWNKVDESSKNLVTVTSVRV